MYPAEKKVSCDGMRHLLFGEETHVTKQVLPWESTTREEDSVEDRGEDSKTEFVKIWKKRMKNAEDYGCICILKLGTRSKDLI